MERAKANSRLEYLRADRLAEMGAPLSAKAARFAFDNAAALRESDPEIPAEITNARGERQLETTIKRCRCVRRKMARASHARQLGSCPVAPI